MKKQIDNAVQDKIDLQALKESEARFRSIVLWSPDAIIVTDANGKIEYMNPAAEGVFNRKLESFIGKDFGLPLVDGESTEIDIFRPGKDPGVGDMHVVEAEWLNKMAHLITIRDITERKKVEDELRASDALLQAAIKIMPVGLWIIDAEGNIKFSSAAAQKIWAGVKYVGIDQLGEYKGWRTDSGKLVEAHEWAGARALEKGETTIEQEVEIECFDGTHKIILDSAVPLRKSDGSIGGAITINQDITERKRAEEEIKKLIKIKSDFISTVSHELRTPLSITKEGISLVLDKVPGDINEKQKGVLQVANNNIDRLSRIINELLDISKIEAGKVKLKKELVDMAVLIRGAASLFELSIKMKGLELKVDIPEKQIDAYIDLDKIYQYFTNLIENAIKFTDKGHIEVSLREKEKEIECVVADTGIGIAGEDLPKVFDKFQQFGRVSGPGEKGTGLGLSITKGIIELHGGRIRAESEPGRGTKFIFNLPKYSAENGEESIKKAKEA